MKGTITGQLLKSHLVEGEIGHGQQIGLRMGQTLTQDTTGGLLSLVKKG